MTNRELSDTHVVASVGASLDPGSSPGASTSLEVRSWMLRVRRPWCNSRGFCCLSVESVLRKDAQAGSSRKKSPFQQIAWYVKNRSLGMSYNREY